MEVHRKLKPHEYVIMEDTLDSGELLYYSDIILYEYEGLYLPERDITMTELFSSNFSSRLERTSREILDMINIIGQTDKSKSKCEALLTGYKVLVDTYNNPKLVKRLQQIDNLTNPYIYCDMEQYLHYLSQYQDYIFKVREY